MQVAEAGDVWKGGLLDPCSLTRYYEPVKRRNLKTSGRETLEKAALLGVEFSVPVLLSAGASPDGLDRLFDDGCLAEAGANRERFAQPAHFRKIAGTIPWSRKRKWHSELAQACEALHQPPSDIAYHYLAAREFEAARPVPKSARSNIQNNYYVARGVA